MSKPPKPLSEGEEIFALNCKVLGIEFEREFHFATGRKYRADFYIKAANLIVEIEGGTFGSVQGRHSRGAGMAQDAAKYNLATRLGYRLLRYTMDMVKRGDAMEDLEAILGIKSNWREE
jgi:very-short-patch-repair endonuclease